MNENIVLPEKENGYLAGVLGSLLGGIIGSIPWILMYVYGNMMYSIITVLIAIGAVKGYELCKGKIDKKLPLIIGIISFFTITIVMWIVIPNLLILKEYGQISLEAFKLLFTINEFVGALVGDYIFALLFTFLGVGGMLASIKQQVASGKKKIDFSNNALKPTDEDMASIKKIFEDKGAFDDLHTIPKLELLELTKDKGITLNFMLSRGFVVYKKGGYYYSLDAEAHPNRKAVKTVLITFGVMFGIMALIFILVSVLGK